MRISKLLSGLCVVAVGAVGLTLRAEDTPAPAAQVKADAKAKPAADKKLVKSSPTNRLPKPRPRKRNWKNLAWLTPAQIWD
jgi:hypothetical protein